MKKSGQGVKSTTQFHLVTRVRLNGTMTLLPPTCLYVVDKDNFILELHLSHTTKLTEIFIIISAIKVLAKSTSLKSTIKTFIYSKLSENYLGNISIKTILRDSLFFSSVIAKTVWLKYKMFTGHKSVLNLQVFRSPRWVWSTCWSSVKF